MDETLRRDRGTGGEEKGKRREKKDENEEEKGATEKRKTKYTRQDKTRHKMKNEKKKRN